MSGGKLTLNYLSALVIASLLLGPLFAVAMVVVTVAEFYDKYGDTIIIKRNNMGE